jgi:hypothetical protein
MCFQFQKYISFLGYNCLVFIYHDLITYETTCTVAYAYLFWMASCLWMKEGGGWTEEVQARHHNQCPPPHATHSSVGAQMARPAKQSCLRNCHHRPEHLPPYMVCSAIIRKAWSSEAICLNLFWPYFFLKYRFHANVNRCYCPSEEVAKRAAVDGLQPSQIRVFGLPIRPSFCRAVLVKVSCSP